MQIHVHGLVIHTQRGEGSVINLVVSANQKHATAFGRLRQYLANALFRAGDLCNPCNHNRPLRVIQTHMGSQGVDDVLSNGAHPNAGEVWPLHFSNGDAYYNPLLIHEGVKQHQHGFWRNILNRLRGQKGTCNGQGQLHEVVIPRDINCVVLPDNGAVELADEKPISSADDEQDAAHTNPVNLDLIGLEKIAQEIAANSRRAFKSAENYPEGSHGRRFIEHGAVCYFNSYAALRRYIDAAAKSTQQSA